MTVMIDCTVCGRHQKHVAHGMCQRCYRSDYYYTHKDEQIKKQQERSERRRNTQRETICKRLSSLMLDLIPIGEDSRHISWPDAARLYNKGCHRTRHYMAICRAVQFNGEPYGLRAHPKPDGGVSIRRPS